MAENDLEKAFSTLAQALTLTETEISEEINLIQQQVEQLKGRIVELGTRQQALNHDRGAIAEMYQRYCEEHAISGS